MPAEVPHFSEHQIPNSERVLDVVTATPEMFKNALRTLEAPSYKAYLQFIKRAKSYRGFDVGFTWLAKDINHFDIKITRTNITYDAGSPQAGENYDDELINKAMQTQVPDNLTFDIEEDRHSFGKGFERFREVILPKLGGYIPYYGEIHLGTPKKVLGMHKDAQLTYDNRVDTLELKLGQKIGREDEFSLRQWWGQLTAPASEKSR